MVSDVLYSEIAALFQVVLIDLVLAGDNAIVVGMAAAGVAAAERRKVIFWGITAAVVLRILFATITVQLLAIIGLMLAGGILLLWVCWKLYRDLREHREQATATELLEGGVDNGAEPAGDVAAAVNADGSAVRVATTAPRKTVRQAIVQVAIADVSMSLDNVLAVAGAAGQHTSALIIGLALSVVLMGVGAALIARILQRHHWVAYVGLALIGWVAVKMIYQGGVEVMHAAGFGL